jgi:hypothetical protein
VLQRKPSPVGLEAVNISIMLEPIEAELFSVHDTHCQETKSLGGLLLTSSRESRLFAKTFSLGSLKICLLAR